MKNIKNNLVDLSQKEAIHIYGGYGIFSASPIVDTIIDSGLAFFVTQEALSKNSDSIIPTILPIFISMRSSCDKKSKTCDNTAIRAISSLSSAVAVAAGYFLPKYRRF